ncbi:MAG TPA: PEP-CTERM sorting domain-containing protein [Fimbriimonadaceae bacterium]|nr:PEP-CTERM sorting domain-containing protein [Fimbriimonadaceae bacterium]
MGGNATVGSSDPTYLWQNSGSGMSHYSFTGTTDNIQMAVVAVPEPLTLAGLGLGIVFLARQRRARA